MSFWSSLLDVWGKQNNNQNSTYELIWGECPASNPENEKITENLLKQAFEANIDKTINISSSEMQSKESNENDDVVSDEMPNKTFFEALYETAINIAEQVTEEIAALDEECDDTPIYTPEQTQRDYATFPTENLRISVLKKTLAQGCLNLDERLKQAMCSPLTEDELFADKCTFTQTPFCVPAMTQTDQPVPAILSNIKNPTSDHTTASADANNVSALVNNNDGGRSSRNDITAHDTLDNSVNRIESSNKAQRNTRKRKAPTAPTRKSPRLK